MKKVFAYFRKHWIEFLFIAIITTLFFHSHIERLWAAIKSLFNSIIYSFKVTFGSKDLPHPPSSFDWMIEVNGNGSFINLLNLNFDVFKKRLEIIGHLIITGDFWSYFASNISSKLLTLIMLFNCLIIVFLIMLIIRHQRDQYHPHSANEETRSLKRFKVFESKISSFFRCIVAWFRTHFSRYTIITLIILFAAYLQLFTIAIDFIANYYLFTTTFDFNIIWKGILLLLVDFLPVYLSIPFIIRLIAIYLIFDRLRLAKADARIRKFADIDIDYLENSGNQIMINGASRSGKGALGCTLAVLYAQELLPQKLLGIMQEVERKFPLVNYSMLRSFIQLKKAYGLFKNQLDIYNEFYERREKFDLSNDPSLFFMDPNSSIAEWDELSIESIDHALTDWALAYFFYSSAVPLSFSNYGIAFNDPINVDDHYFNVSHLDALQESPDDFIRRKMNMVINYDYLRQGKRFKSYGDPNTFYVPDIGLYTITEIGKERGSSESVKKADSSADKVNQKNDKFRERLQIWSHAATIRFQTLFKVIADEQRNLGLNAETRATFESIILIDRRKLKKGIALSSWNIEALLCKLLIIKFDEYSLRRSEIKQSQSLPNYLLKKIIKHINLYFYRRINKYSYSEIKVIATNGSTEDVQSDIEQKKLYIINKIAYSGRYETASLKKLFLNEMAKSRLSIEDLRQFTSLSPSPGDYDYMNSYSFNDLFNKKKE